MDAKQFSLFFAFRVTLRKRLEAHAPGLTPRSVLETLSDILMLDVHLPLADGRERVLPRSTQPEPEHRPVLEKLGWELPAQPPPRQSAPPAGPRFVAVRARVSSDQGSQ